MVSEKEFNLKLDSIGYFSLPEKSKLYKIAKCAKTTGVPLAGAGAVMGASAGAVTIPGVGAIPGYVQSVLLG